MQSQMKAQERADRMADALRRKNKHLFRLPLRTSVLPANTPGIVAPAPGPPHLVRMALLAVHDTGATAVLVWQTPSLPCVHAVARLRM